MSISSQLSTLPARPEQAEQPERPEHAERSPAVRAGRFGRLHRLTLVAVVVLSFGMRLWELGSPRALWLDEQYIAIVIKDGDFGSLVGFLPLIQSAPVLWLWLEKVLMGFTLDEHVLRAPSLIGSCVGVVAAVLLARRVFRFPATLAMAVLAGIIPTMVYYATIMKPYGIDLAATFVLLWLTVRAVQDGRHAAFWYTAAGTVWISQTALFVVATSGAVLLWLNVRQGGPRLRSLPRAPLAVAALSGAVLYLVHVRPNIEEPLMPWWWARFAPLSMAPWPLRVSSLIDWAAESSLTNIELIMPAHGRLQAYAMLGLLIAGGRLLWRRDRVLGTVMLAPVALAMALAITHRYPLWERVSLWLVPPLLFLLCVVVDELTPKLVRLVRDPDRPAVQLGGYLAGALAVAVIIGAGYTGPALRTDEGWLLSRYGQIREAYRYIAQHAGPNDRVYIHRYSVASAVWYAERCGLRWTAQFDYTGTVAGFPRDAKPLADPPQGTLAWFVSGINADDGMERLERAELDRRGEIVVDRTFSQVMVLAYRADPKPATGQPLIGLRIADKQIYQEPMSAFTG